MDGFDTPIEAVLYAVRDVTILLKKVVVIEEVVPCCKA